MGKHTSSKAVMVLLIAAGPFAGAAAHVQQFEASWEESRWLVDIGEGTCALTHDIPRFGQARFEQRYGYRLRFSLHVDQPPVREQRARVHSLVPPWKHEGDARSLGDISLEEGKTPLQLPREQALRLYYELEQGMKPVIEFNDWGDGRDQVQVALMPVRFREALPRFLDCTAGLRYLDFEPVSEETVLFDTDSARLGRSAQRTLAQVARDFRGRQYVRIVLEGHADERGTGAYNRDLSRRRVLMVSRYLRSRGVPAEAIDSSYFGESRPLDPRSNIQGWRRNRRVTIWLGNKE